MDKQPRFFKIGRSDDNEIIVDHITVSRNHAEIFVDPYENIFLTDRNSKYGTKVNGQKIYEPVILQFGDVVLVGDEQMVDWEHIIFGRPKAKVATKKAPKKKANVKKGFDFRYYLDVMIIYGAIILMMVILYFQNS